MEQYWNQTIDFETYMTVSKDRTHNNPNPNDSYQSYYELGLQRMERTLKTFKVQPEALEKIQRKNFQGKILIISEPWCGDASATVPAVARFMEAANIETRIFLKDDDTSLIEQFLTNGTQSIPKIIILSEDFSVKATWGPRPKYGMQLLKKHKENPETYPKETFYNDLQIYYAKNRGKDAIEELIDLI